MTSRNSAASAKSWETEEQEGIFLVKLDLRHCFLNNSEGGLERRSCGRCKVAAAAAKSLQSCPTLCDPIDGSPPGSPVPGILQARTLEWVAISFSNV